jgi:Dolichyl-phosphate-mannose-protein mannosyltransferase
VTGERRSVLPAGRWRPTPSTVVGVVVVVGVALGLFLRLWFVFHAPTSSDEAVAGLIAQRALHGHFTAFYWGQSYGGTAEPDLIAIAFLFFGQTGVVAELVVTALTGVAAVLTWRVARRVVSPRVAPLAGVLAWAAPAVAIRDSTIVYGFRGVTLVCGLAAVLLALRMLDGPRRIVDFAGFGFVVGVGWWSSPEIAYYAVPAALIVVGAVASDLAWRGWWRGSLVALGAAVVGALPWLWVNLGSGFPSLHHAPSTNLAYGDRLSVFFRNTLPMEVGLRIRGSGAWIPSGGHNVWLAFVVAYLVVTLALCLARGGRSLAIGLGVVVFPFLYAVSPFSGDWHDGRYGGYLVPLLALMVTIGTCEALRRLRAARWIAPVALSTVVALATALAVLGMRQEVHTDRMYFTSGWGDPDAPTLAAISKLEAARATAGYTGYWVAYKLDFLSRGRLTFTPIGPAAASRSTRIDAEVARRKGTAWIFVPLNEAARGGVQFVLPFLVVGPGGVSERQFTDNLQHLGIPFRRIDAGVLDAIVPGRTLTPTAAQVPGDPPPDQGP